MLIIFQVNLICCQKDENSGSMMTFYVEVLSVVLNASEKLDQGEHILIGGWIDRYFSDCSRNMFGNLTQILIDIFQKCNQITNKDANLGKIMSFLKSRILNCLNIFSVVKI